MAEAKRPPGLVYNEADIDAVVRTMLGEAAGEGDDGLAAVAHVLVNRYERGNYGGSLYDVAHAKKQFSAWNDSTTGGNRLVDVPADDPRYIKARAIAEEVLNGRHADNTGGATNYFAPKGMTGKKGTVKGDPSWAGEMAYTTTIGGHKFYSDDSAAGAAERMSKGSNVRTYQQQLAERGFDPGAVDGINGPRTKAAVKAFQKANGLVVDGIVGPKTMAALAGQARPSTQRQPPPTSASPLQTLLPPNLPLNPELPPRPRTFWTNPKSEVLPEMTGRSSVPPRTLTPDQTAQEADNGRLNGYRAIQEMGPSSKGARPNTLGGAPTGSSLGFRPLPAPAPLVAPSGGLTTRSVTTVPIDPLTGNPMTGPAAPTPAPLPGFLRPVVSPAAAPAAPGGVGAILGGLGSTLGQGMNFLGSKAREAATTLGNTASHAVEDTKTALSNTAEMAKDEAIRKLMSTVGGRTWALNAAMGITPAKKPDARAADRNASAPAGFAYGTTGKRAYQIGKTYQSSRGPVVFNGKTFDPVTAVKSEISIMPSNRGSNIINRSGETADQNRSRQIAEGKASMLDEFGMIM